jgi:hypothetical protein
MKILNVSIHYFDVLINNLSIVKYIFIKSNIYTIHLLVNILSRV